MPKKLFALLEAEEIPFRMLYNTITVFVPDEDRDQLEAIVDRLEEPDLVVAS
ncbi:MAG TPA: hypothetical protein VKQ30_24930 [Ktedonobacterales bacterium]|nr:hypothetical protein [Ktedonobacterales bacterium]